MQDRHILPGSIDTPERGLKVVEGVVVAHQNQDVIFPDSHRLGSEFLPGDEMELVEFLVNALARTGDLFGNRENGEEHNRKGNSGDGGNLLGEKIDQGNTEKHQGNEARVRREFPAPRYGNSRGHGTRACPVL